MKDREPYKLFYLLGKGQALVSRFEKTELGNNAPSFAVITKKIGWYRQVLQGLYNYNGTPYAQKVTIPVLALHGSADRIISLSAAQSISTLVKGAQLHQLEGVGHGMVFSHGEVVAREIKEFVTATHQVAATEKESGGKYRSINIFSGDVY